VSRVTVGVVDYGVGNLASIGQALHALGYRFRVSDDPDSLERTSLLILPGVGAFPHAMDALHAEGLDEFIKEKARAGMPIVGICLGMQLLADASTEVRPTAGLGLIPGEVEPFRHSRWHIGWNSIEVRNDDPLLADADGLSVYFNHSFVFHASGEYQMAVARLKNLSRPFPVAVHRNNVVGLQFHPEKSQSAGRLILARVIEGLVNA